MEKQTFYEKLKQLKPIVKAYFDTKKIADTPERLYLLEKCGTSKPSFATDSIKSEEINSLKKTQKILTIVLGLAMVWGVVCAIIGIVNLSGMDIALGLGILIGAFFLYRSLNGKFKEKLCAAQEQQIRVDEYNKQIEKVKAEHRAAVESLEEKHKLKEKNPSVLFQTYEHKTPALNFYISNPHLSNDIRRSCRISCCRRCSRQRT